MLKMNIVLLYVIALSLTLLGTVACQPDQPTPQPVIQTEVAIIQPTATAPPATLPPTFTATPAPPTETPLPTIEPTPFPTATAVWNILFLGTPCYPTASDCEAYRDTPPSEHYSIYSDGNNMQLLSMLGIPYNDVDKPLRIALSPNRKQIAYVDEDKHVWIGDVDSNNFTKIHENADPFSVLAFWGNDPNCLVNFGEQRRDGELIVSLYKNCIDYSEPILIDTAIVPLTVGYTSLFKYRLSPEADKWLLYRVGRYNEGNEVVLYVKEIGDTHLPELIFQKQPRSCSESIHWQNNETIEFLYAVCGSADADYVTYFYVIDWEGKELQTRYVLPPIKHVRSGGNISDYYAPEFGDWFADNNLFAFSISWTGNPPPLFNGIYVLNLTTGELQQIVSNIRVGVIRPWLPVITNTEE